MSLFLTIILLFPMPMLDKIEHYMQLILIISVYMLIMNDKLSDRYELSYAEKLIYDIFIYAVMIIIMTLFVQLFFDNSTKSYHIP